MTRLPARVGSLLVVLLTLAFVTESVAAERASVAVGWRGDGTGRYSSAVPPQTWSKSAGIVWKTELPGRGYSSPVLWNGQIFLTAEPAHVLCLDAASGAVRWQRSADYVTVLGEAKAAEIKATQTRLEEEKRALSKRLEAAVKLDPKSPEVDELKPQVAAADQRRHDFERQFPSERRGGAGNAAATPVCDGQRVYVAFGTGIVAAYDLAGTPVWSRHIEAPREGFGHSASPVLAGGRLIVHFHDLVGLDAETGKDAWRTPLAARFGTPLATRLGTTDVLVSPAGAIVRATDGRVLGKGLFEMSNNSPLLHDGVLYVHGNGKVKALRLPPEATEPLALETLWESSSTREQRMASSVYHDGLLYGATRNGILDVTDAKTGEKVYQKRLEIGEIFSSLAVAGDLVFVTGNDAKSLVLRPGREFAEQAANGFDRINSSPVFDGGRLFVRTDKHLVCLGE